MAVVRTMRSVQCVSSMRRAVAFAAALLAVVPGAFAQVTVDAPWIRSSVPGQLSTGAFMDLTSARDATLIKVDSAIAGIVEVHTMEMKGNLMTMRAIDKLALPSGKRIRLAPGGFLIMLMDLKQPVTSGEIVPIRLTFEYADRKQETVLVSAPVRALGAAPEPQHQHK